jgi:transcriptional regulator with XRE-family HTH domain
MSNPKPGTMLKNLRVERGWKLSDLAARTGLQVSTLSKMENGKVALTYDKLAQISKALDVDVGSFFGPPRGTPPSPTGTGRRSIIRAGEGQEIQTDTYHHLYQATDLLNKRFIPMIAYTYAKSMEEFGDWMRHPGEEYTYVLEGTVDFYSELYAPVRLGKGDAIYFDSSMGHAYIAVGDEPCRGLTICAGDETQSMPAREPAVHRANNTEAVVLEPLPPVATAKSVQKIRTGS